MFEDATDHGTSVAAIIASSGVMTELEGINPYAEIYSVRVLDENNVAPISRIIEGIEWAIDNDMDIIMSINMGGDDYITKPFSPQVLVAKIQAILRRTYSYNKDLKSDIIKFKDVTLNIVEGKIYFKDENVDLTKNELKIMNILMLNQEKIVTREEIIEELWETDEFISENTLTVNVNRLRKKLSSIGLDDFIETKKGQGYIIR